MHHKNAFTLIELLIVIAVIAIVSVVIVLVLNPAELLRESRDTNRLSDMASMVDAFNVYAGEGGTSYGSANTINVSIPDPTATSTAGDQCQGLGLISLPATYTYHCAASSTYRAIDGTGWIPVNFNAVASRSPLGQLPIDPVNTSSSRLYYTYTTNGTQYEVTSVMESQKYGLAGSNDVISGDGGTLASVYERGTQLGLEPLDYGDSSLVGYWTLDEGTGTIAYDYSGNNATGSWTGTQGGSSGYYSAGTGGSWAGYFDGGNDTLASDTDLNILGALTYSAWINPASFTSGGTTIMSKCDFSSGAAPCAAWLGIDNTNGTDLEFDAFKNTPEVYIGREYSGTLSANKWYQVVATYDGGTSSAGIKLYVNGVRVDNTDDNSGAFTGINNVATPFIIGAAANSGLSPDYGMFNFKGLISDVRIYNRALSAAQIAAMYNAGK